MPVKLATLLCVLVSFLLAQCTPAQAISSSYFAEAAIVFQACGEPVGCLPFGATPGGIGITVFPGSTSTPPPIQIGDAFAITSARSGGGVDLPPTINAGAVVFGRASAPPDSFAASFASAVRLGVLINLTDTTQVFPLWFHHTRLEAGSSIGQDQFASAHAHASYQFLLDGNLLIGADVTQGSTGLDQVFLIPLTPGFHSFLLEVQADGFASAQIEPIPEPATRLLFGTSAAGLGLVRWYRRRAPEREHAA